MTDERRELRETANAIRSDVRNILALYVYLKRAIAEASSMDLGAILERLRLDLGMASAPRVDSDAQLFVWTLDRIVKAVDVDMKIKGACLAAGWKLIYSKHWSYIAQCLHVDEDRAEEIVNQAVAKLYGEFVGRNITHDYRSLPGYNAAA